MTFWVQSVLVFASLIAVDVCWAKYIEHTAAKNACKAATWASLILASGSFATVSYVSDHRLIVAAVLGSFVGTYIAVRRAK